MAKVAQHGRSTTMKDLKPITATQEQAHRRAQKAALTKDFDRLSEQARRDILRIVQAMADRNL